MARTPLSVDRTVFKLWANDYVAEVAYCRKVANSEMGVRAAFQRLLTRATKHYRWFLVPEMTLGKIRPDGVVLDEFRIRRGYWEAKGPLTNLEKEIAKKIEHGYPLTNTIFEDSNTAVLYQNKIRVLACKLDDPNNVVDLLDHFFTYVEPDIENFEQAVDEFKERIPEHAQALLDLIAGEHKRNLKFKVAFGCFAKLCRDSIDPHMDDVAINEMLVQHLLTERLFRTVFNNPDFVRRNVIAAEIEKVIDVLAIRSFNRSEFLKILDRFYVAIERAARGIESWSERQEFLNTVYERFFQGFSVKKADTHGIVYTPQEIVDFMVESVDVVLKQAFGKSIETPGVKILDPATGTGNFIVNIVRRLPGRVLKEKYTHDLFCNEIMLLPYYIASLNIEHEYYAQMQQYEPFAGICFADTLELAEGRQLSLFVEENTERVKREKEADIMVVIGNPPYNAKQVNENDNNKNRRYKTINERIRETYAKDSEASNKNALSDVYVQFFRWAADRFNTRDGIVCLVTNNSFVDQIAFDGMRMHLSKDFNQIYHLDLHGNVRKNPQLSGTTHNVFGIQISIGITIAIRNTKSPERFLKYYRVPEHWQKTEKLAFLQEKASIANIDWLTLQPDKKFTWITNGLQTEFATFLPIGSRNTKAIRTLTDGSNDIEAIFKTYSPGAQTNRDIWMYDFDSHNLAVKASAMIETYNAELSRWMRAGFPKNVDNFVLNDETKIKWCSRLKEYFTRKIQAHFRQNAIRHSLARPFTRQFLYFDNMMTHRPGMFAKVFPTVQIEAENRVICVPSVGNRKEFGCLATDMIPKQDLAFETSQCFPYYTYTEDGSNRRENITDWALKQFQAKYGKLISKWDIFHYIYGILHHPQYRALYRENLKRDLPHIPLVLNEEAFAACVRVGKQLMKIHVHYEKEKEYPLCEIYNREVPYEHSLRVERMKLAPDRATLIVSPGLTLAGIPQECFSYSLGNRSALEWVIDQYRVSTDKRSGIESDPNRIDDPEYIVRLVKQVVTVSVKTVELVRELAEVVTAEDWAQGIDTNL